jgi:hypothetical protein
MCRIQTGHIQATNIAVEDNLGEVTITAVYCHPKHNTKHNEYEHFFKTLGHSFEAKKHIQGVQTHDNKLTRTP